MKTTSRASPDTRLSGSGGPGGIQEDRGEQPGLGTDGFHPLLDKSPTCQRDIQRLFRGRDGADEDEEDEFLGIFLSGVNKRRQFWRSRSSSAANQEVNR